MKKAILFVVVSAFVGFTVLSASADDMVSGTYDPNQSNSGVMSVGQTIIQMGAVARINANAVSLGSGAAKSRTDTGALSMGTINLVLRRLSKAGKPLKRLKRLRFLGWFRAIVRATTLMVRIARQ